MANGCKIVSLLAAAVCGFSWEPVPPNFNVSRPDTLLNITMKTKYPWKPFPFDQVYIFGDSSCDTGRYSHLAQGRLMRSGQAYWRGRFSNGPAWPDYLGAMNRVRVNSFCYGGAVIDGNGFVLQPGAADALSQVELFRREKEADRAAKPLAVIQFVGNDMLNLFESLGHLKRGLLATAQSIVDSSNVRNFLVVMATCDMYVAKGYDLMLAEVAEELMQRNPGVEAFAASSVEQYYYMSYVPPPNADPAKWSNTPCYNEFTNQLCSDPENHFLIDNYHFTTYPYYSLAARISRLIVGYWGQ